MAITNKLPNPIIDVNSMIICHWVLADFLRPVVNSSPNIDNVVLWSTGGDTKQQPIESA